MSGARCQETEPFHSYSVCGGRSNDVDFTARTVAYYGCNGEKYIEAYPIVEVN